MPTASALRALPARLLPLANGPSLSSRRTFATTVSRQKVYGFVGLGRMGTPMATNLRKNLPSTDSLLVNDLNIQAAEQLVGELKSATGPIEAISSAREVAEKSDILITCLPMPKAVSSCYDTILPSGLPAPPSEGERLFIDCSTIDPLTSRGIAEAIHSTQTGRFVDAPMSGGVVGARAATLTFMFGAPAAADADGADALVARVKAVLELMGKRAVHLGGQGAGLAAKLANNYLLAVSNIATAEAMNLGVKLGLDPKALGDLINTSSGRCWSSEVNNPVPGVVPGAPAERDYEGGFGTALMYKDIGLAMFAAKEAGAKLELGDETERVYRELAEAEKGKDFSVVYRWLSRDDPSS